ncbi:MAG: hybrid sensor histidine kinase/response regulator [Deltaproteobacteria bacterium]|nr:MAG: hybrid sensor histidine kinase/response regulator [Deltaproteobacteria bacterium]
MEIKVFSKTGKEILVYHTSTPIYDETGQVTGVALEGVDISELKEKEKVLVEEKERLSVTLRSIGDGVICTNREGIVVLINKVAEKLTGWKEKEAISRPVSEVFHIVNEKTRERCENPVERVLETGGVVGLANNTVLIAKDGTERILADSGAPIRDREGKIIGVVLVFRDITEKRVIEEELQKMEKLESIGILAGGIAHDFNNLLMGILGNVGLAKIYMKTEEPDVTEKLTDAEKACFRAKELTQQLLVFSKGGAPIKKLTSISELIIDTVTFVLRGSNVRCEFSIPEDLWPVEIDEGQMSQVISNLVINADQAMPKGGIIQVRAENIVMEKLPSLTLRPGRYIKITIEDNGIGIPREYLSKIFDPYFSTKQTGSGLGLATAYSVIKRHDGDIRVESELGVGTTFYIYLPASEKPFPAKEEKEERILTGSGKILIMDDEMIVRKVTGEMLTYIGYKVEYARDGAEAIEIYKREKEKGEPFDAVILDLTVAGGMGGKEAIEKLLEIDPKVRAIVSSGYSNDPIMANFREYGFRAMVVKPYKIKVLSKAVREAMKD